MLQCGCLLQVSAPYPMVDTAFWLWNVLSWQFFRPQQLVQMPEIFPWLCSSHQVLSVLKSSHLPTGHYLPRCRSRLQLDDMLVWAASHCHATVVMPFWLFLLCSGPNKNNPRMPLCPKTSYGTLFLDAEQLQTIKQYGAWAELSSLLPWAHIQCSPGLFLASVGADLRLRMGECPSVLQVRFTADPKGAYSKQYSTSMWAAQPFQKSGWYLMANLCRAPWLQCLWLLRRCSHAYAE